MKLQREFGVAEAAHLLTRLQFGVREEQIQQAVDEGLDVTLQRLCDRQPESPEFETVASALHSAALATGQLSDLQSWWHYRLQHSRNQVQEKLTLHWHNHFATSFVKVRSVPYMARQNELFRKYAGGSFPDLLNAVARDPAMLIWLDGSANRKRHPNENFAREVMELFCLGEGHYTEQDVQEAARAFSGWQLRNGAFWQNEAQHDLGQKTVFGKTGAWQGADILTLCLEHPACPRFLAWKLLRTFVSARPSDALLQQTSQAYVRHHLETLPVLKELCQSPEFYDTSHRRTMIKSPIEFVIGTLRSFDINWPLPRVRLLLSQLGQAAFVPPSVKGWEGDRLWIQSNGWIQRWNFLAELAGHFPAKSDGLEDGTATAQIARWNLVLFGNCLEESVLKTLERRWEEAASQSFPVRSQQLLQLALALPEYQLM